MDSQHGGYVAAVTASPLDVLPADLRAEVQRELSSLWPDAEIPWAVLGPRLLPRLPPVAGPLVCECVLVAAALINHPAAVEQLDGLLRTEAARQARRRGVDPSELTQAVRTRLLSPEERGGRLAGWDGRGPFPAWLRVVTARIALNLRREADPVGGTAPDRAGSSAGPEVALLRREYGAHFKASFAAAVATLPPRSRTLLRLYTVEGLSLARLGTMYRCDASTASRWLEQARTALGAATRLELKTRLAVSDDELDSVVRAADLELSASLSRLLLMSGER